MVFVAYSRQNHDQVLQTVVLICMHLRHFLFKEKIVQRAERSIFLHLVNRHFLAVYRQFDKAAPAVKLMGADLTNILRIAVRTPHRQNDHPVLNLISIQLLRMGEPLP